MLKCVGLYTREVDEPELALSEILAQLSEKVELMENTVGIIMCHTEFVDSGVVKHIGENLPFEVAGSTTSAQAVNGLISEMALAVFVITSDTVRFRLAMTESMETEIEGPLRAAIERISNDTEQPKLAIAFPPLMLKNSGDDIMEIWTKILPEVPVFGTLAVDDSADLSGGKVIYRGEAEKIKHSFILFYGDINPRFLIATLPEATKLPHKGEITKSKSNIVYEIDGRNAYDYLKNVGFATAGESIGVFWFVPFLLSQQKREDYDGVPVVRGLASVTEEGAAIFRGRIDEGSVFTLLNMTAEDVVVETKAKLLTINDMPDVNGVIVFSCVVRHLLHLHKNPLEEIEHANEALADLPFMMSYAGGEFCPTSVKDGVPVNRFHNYSLVALVI